MKPPTWFQTFRLGKVAVYCAFFAFVTSRCLAQVSLPPVVTVPPLGATVQNGGTVTLSATATSLTTVSFNWLLNGQPVSPANSSVVNTSVIGVGWVSTLTVSNIIPANAGNYSVQVANGIGTVTSLDAPVSVIGGISIDHTSYAKSSSSGSTTLTWSHTTGSGSEGFLLVEVCTGSGRTVSGITYAGVALTRIAYVETSTAQNSPSTEMWYLENPPAGTASIAVSLSSKDTCTGSATSFFGVNQTLPFSYIVSGTGGTNKPTVSLASAPGELVVDSVAGQAATSGTNASGQTLLTGQFTGSGVGNVWGSASFRPGATATTMSWVLGGSSGGLWSAGALSLKPSSTPVPVISGLSVDATDSANMTGSSNTLSWTHVTGSGANRLLVVGVATGSGKTVSSVTYGGMPLSQIGAAVIASGSHPRTEMWSLKSPPVGAATVTVTLNGKDTCAAGAMGFFGVNESAPFGTFRSAAATGLTPSVTVPATSSQLVVDSIAVQQATAGSTGVGQTLLWNQFSGAGISDVWGSSSFEPGSTNTVMSWNLSSPGSASEWAVGAVSVNSAPGAGTLLSSAGRLVSNGFTLHFSGLAPSTYIVQVSTNLLNWTPVSTNFTLSGDVGLTDSAATNRSIGYYRVVPAL